MSSDIAIGIDLGTTNCCVAVYYNDDVIVIPNQAVDGSNTTPSYVAFNKDKSVIVGKPAKDKSYRNLDTTIYDAKRIIGREFKDPILQHDIPFWPFKVKEDKGIPKIEINGTLYHPEEISAKLLSEMRDIAESHLQLDKGSIKKAVITVPAYFNDGQRQATMDAGKLAGLDVLCILNEPTAAAIAYFNKRLEKSSKKVMIFDLGGGTLDVAVVEISAHAITVLGIHGDTHLGGQDFDKNMMLYCIKKFKEETGIDLQAGKDSENVAKRHEVGKNLRRLQMTCEKAKRCLSAKARSAEVDIDGIVSGKDLCIEITKETFDTINSELFQKCINVVEEALMGAEISKDEIEEIILIGGSSRINKIQSMLEGFFVNKKLNVSINPDEAVAYGAAVQAAILSGRTVKKLEIKQIQDVTGLSLGIKLFDGRFHVIIPRNSNIPVKKWKRYCAPLDNATSQPINVFQGEDRIADSNKFLGRFVLSGFANVKRGDEICDVIMEINQNGILHVAAVSIDAKSKSELTVVAQKDRMSESVIEKLLTEMKM